MNLKEATDRARKIGAYYHELEKKKYGREWNTEELMLGFLGDVGDLAKLVQSKAGIRSVSDLDNKLAHELADCLWCVLILANQFDIDIEAAFETTMLRLEEEIRTDLSGNNADTFAIG